MKKSIVIVGGGVIGCITAIELKKKGFDITIIDKGQMAEGGILCCWGNFISINALELQRGSLRFM